MSLALKQLLVKTMLEDRQIERRRNVRDRRRLQTYIANDRRSGVADRRLGRSLILRLVQKHL
jgi:hypothetical protein